METEVSNKQDPDDSSSSSSSTSSSGGRGATRSGDSSDSNSTTTRNSMLSSENELDEVELVYTMPVTVNGDTLVYDADSFNDVVVDVMIFVVIDAFE